MGIAADERKALCDLFTEVGPDAPTLCGGWLTRDLAAHLVVRERRPDAAAGILAKPLAGYLDKVQAEYAKKPWRELVDLVRSGPPWFFPTSIGAVDEMINVAEFFVHHEDVRRAGSGWQPRPQDRRRDAAVWAALGRAGKLAISGSPVGIVLRTPSGKTMTVQRGPTPVTVDGEPGELMLFAFGRDVARVSFDGDPAAITTVQELNRGL